MLPEGWKLYPIKHVCSEIVDCVNKTAPTVDFSTPYRMIRTTNVRNGRVDTRDVRCVTRETYAQWTKRGKPQSGDLIFTREAPVGEVGILIDAQGFFLGQRTMMYRADSKKTSNLFLFYSLESPFCKKQIEDFSNGGTVAHMRVPDCGEITILLPPLTEQRKIAAILSTWDRAIEVTEKLLANSQQQKKALMQQLLTGKKRLPGFTGEWVSLPLASCCTPQQWVTISSKDLTVSGFPVYGANGFIGYFPEYNHSNDTVAITCRGSTCGTVSIIKGPSYITGNSMCLDRVKEDVSDIYLFYYLSYRGLKDIISGSAQPQIVGEAIRKVGIELPSLPEQKAIASVLTKADEEITLLKSDLSRLRQEKKALMQQLLTGKRRVKLEADAG
ncbi:restriction endonuclease subunit S [Asaia sp. HN010]|uniref:restriction endonuclease subunit S n=1 Tax=Asaia sp. HN010 TaxID=3081233 RepID=UPI00301791D8